MFITGKVVVDRPSVFNFDLISTTSAVANSITIPSTCQPGDLAVLMDGAVTYTGSIPSGFTQIATTNNPSGRMYSSYKILTSGDIGTSVTGMSASSPRKVLNVFRSAAPISSINISSTINQPTAGSWATLSASYNIDTTVSTDKAVIAFNHVYSATIGTYSVDTMTDTSSSDSTRQRVAFQIYNIGNTRTSLAVSLTGTSFLGYQGFFLGLN